MGNSDAKAWTGFMNLVPGEDDVYEATIPQYNEADVEWIYAIAVACPSDAKTPCFTEGEMEYQTQTFYYSKLLAVNQYIVLDGTLDGEYKAHANINSDYTDDVRANKWGQRFIDPDVGVICYGGTKPPYIARWNQLQAEYNQMATEAKKIVTNAVANESGCYYEQAVARYDYICRKYNTKEEEIYEDYANREDAGKFTLSKVNNISLFGLLSDENNTSTIIIVVASSLSLISITALSMMLIKKKKKTINK